ncbi:MAG: TonB-dependent receptor [Sphingomonadales bacterium]
MFIRKRLGFKAFKMLALVGVGTALVWVDIPSASAQLESVTVSARKREETVQELPTLVNVVSEQRIEDFSLNSLDDVARISPAINMTRTSSGSGARISMRGVDNSPTSTNIAQDVAIIVDGVYYPNGRVISEAMIDVGQIEILKGPQTLFQGKNAISGAVNLRTNDPGDDFELFGKIGYETKMENLYAHAVISVPVTDKFGIRVAGAWSHMFDGYMKNDALAGTATFRDAANNNAVHVLDVPAPSTGAWPGEKNYLARVTMKFEPTDEFTLRLKAHVSDYYSTSPGGVTEIARCTFNAPQNNPAVGPIGCMGDWRTAGNPYPKELAALNPIAGRKGGELYAIYSSYSVTADAAYMHEDFSLQAVINYHHNKNAWLGDNDGPSARFVTAAGEEGAFRAFSGEVRFLSTWDSWINFMIGSYFQTTHQLFDQFVETGGAYNSAVEPANRYVAYNKHGTSNDTTYSAFGQFIFTPVEGLELTAGGRYTHEEINANFVQPYVNPNFKALWLEGDPLSRELIYNDFSPEFTANWNLTREWAVYARYATGFKQGGFSLSGIRAAASDRGGEEFVFDPQTVRGFEGGVKAALFDDRLRLQLGGYNYTFRDFQVDYFNSPTFAQVTTNAGSVKITGAEFEFEYAPKGIDGLVIGGSAAYNNARYADFIAPCFAGQKPSEGCNIFTPGVLPRQDLSGAKTPLSPEWVLGLNANYDWKFGNGLVAGITANAMYKSKYQLMFSGRPDSFQKGYALLDLSARIGAEDDRWQLSIICKNVTNKYALYYATDASGSGAGTGTEAGIRADLGATPNQPRTIAIELSLRY